MSDSGSEDNYGLVMPFVAVASRGGPYEDAAFVAGYRAGLIDAELKAGGTHSRYVETDLVAQLDLVAMCNGYVMSSQPWADDPFWSLVQFRQQALNDEVV
jgi:hypothetical protein